MFKIKPRQYGINTNIKTKLGEEKHAELTKYFHDNYADLFEKKEISKAVSAAAIKYSIGETSIHTQIIKPLKEQFNLRRPAKKKEKSSKGLVSYTPEECLVIKKLFEEGNFESKLAFYEHLKNTNALKDRLASRTTVDRALEKAGAATAKFNNPKRTERKLAIKDLWDQGKRLDEIIALYADLSEQTVEVYLRECGVTFDTTKDISFKKEVLDYYQEHGTEETIKKYGIPQNTQSRWRQELGIPARDNSESHRKYTLNQQFFDVIDDEVKAHHLGLYAADGNVTDNTIALELQSSDISLVNIVRNSVGTDKELYPTMHHSKQYGTYKPGIKLDLISTHMMEQLKKYGIVPNKSLLFDINLDLIPKHLHRHFWRGTVDGDGSLFLRSKKYHTIELYGTKAICKKFLSFIEEALGIKGKLYAHHSIWRATFQKSKEAIKVAKFLYDDCTIFLQRKKELAVLWSLKDSEFSQYFNITPT